MRINVNQAEVNYLFTLLTNNEPPEENKIEADLLLSKIEKLATNKE